MELFLTPKTSDKAIFGCFSGNNQHDSSALTWSDPVSPFPIDNGPGACKLADMEIAMHGSVRPPLGHADTSACRASPCDPAGMSGEQLYCRFM
jgi:hypothetical protein